MRAFRRVAGERSPTPLPPRRRRPPARARRRGVRSRAASVVAGGLLLVALEAVPGGPPPAVAEAHATCDGADHTHWHMFPWPHKDEWVYVKSRSIDRYRYQNYFVNRTDGGGDWSGDCPF